MKDNLLSLILVPLLVGFALLQPAQAVLPPPDGGYANFTTAEGDNALKHLTTGVGNTAIGSFSLFSVSTGNFNTAVGAGSLDLNLGNSNTASGAAALLFNTIGNSNTADGAAALEFNQTGNQNTATGAFALFSNTTGTQNTATGAEALFYNTTGSGNTAAGFEALLSNTTGNENIAIGPLALYSNTEGSSNTAIGPVALSSNATGIENTTVGYQAIALSTSGSSNTAIGVYALGNNGTGNSNTALGQRAGLGVTTADNVICIGTAGANVSNSCYIGGIAGQVVGLGGSACYVDNDGKLGVFLSSRRFKTDIADMAAASEALLSLRPVTFHYKPELDKTGLAQFGLIAEEVEAIDPSLVVRDKEGKVSTVRYEAVNIMLLNEFLKEHQRVQEQQAAITELKSTLGRQEKIFQATAARQQKQIEALTTGLQKVSAQIELNKRAPQTVVNNR